MATEIVTLKVKDDFTVEACQKALAFLSPPPKGLQTFRWGYAIGIANTVIWILNWDAVADHEAFIKASIYPTFLHAVKSFCAAPITLYHTHLQPFPPTKVFEAGLIELTALTKKPELSHEQFLAAFDELIDLVTPSPGYQSHFIGTMHEDPEVYIGLFGWDSAETANQVQLSSLMGAMVVQEKSSFIYVKLHPQ